MNSPAKNTAPASAAATAAPTDALSKARAARKAKVQSPTRLAAELALKNAKSDQEKAAARGHVKVVRFKELASPRVNRAIRALSNVETLANRNGYTYTEAEAGKIVAALEKKLATIKTKFAGAKADDSFTL